MATVLTNWKDIPGDSREKYQLYLASREWSVKKEAVHERSGGICERCGMNPADHVHHMTYERKYAERLEDLADFCKGCHEWWHDKSKADPRPADPLSINLIMRPRLVSQFGDVTIGISRKAFDKNHLVGELSPTEKVVSLSIQQEATEREDQESFFSKMTVDLCEREVGELIAWLQAVQKRQLAANKREAE